MYWQDKADDEASKPFAQSGGWELMQAKKIQERYCNRHVVHGSSSPKSRPNVT